MRVEIQQESVAWVAQQARISIAFRVESVLELTIASHGLGGLCLSERPLNEPHIKNYDALPNCHPSQWAGQFEMANWGFFSAKVEGAAVGGAVVAWGSPGLEMLESRTDLAVIWDVRVAPGMRRQGIAVQLFAAAERWALSHNCSGRPAPACTVYLSCTAYLPVGAGRVCLPVPFICRARLFVVYLSVAAILCGRASRRPATHLHGSSIMPWPFGSSNKVAPAPARTGITLSKDNPLCLKFSEWKCKQRRYNGDGKRSCYCYMHTCEAPACINVVAGPKQRYCQKHQLNALQPKPRSRPLAEPVDNGRLDGHQRQLIKKGAQTQIFLRHQAKVDAETKAVVAAIGEVATGASFRSMMKSETSISGQFMDALFDNKLTNDLQWKGMAEYLNGKMQNYIVQEKNFAAEFCQDLLVYCSAKIEQADVEFVVFVGKLFAFPLLAPYIAIATGAAAAGGAIAGQAASAGFSAAKAGVAKGATVAAKKAMGLEDPTKLAGRPDDIATQSQGWVTDALEYFTKSRLNPITFARVLGRHLESHRSGAAEKAIVKHFGPSILFWDDRLAPGSFLL